MNLRIKKGYDYISEVIYHDGRDLSPYSLSLYITLDPIVDPELVVKLKNHGKGYVIEIPREDMEPLDGVYYYEIVASNGGKDKLISSGDIVFEGEFEKTGKHQNASQYITTDHLKKLPTLEDMKGIIPHIPTEEEIKALIPEGVTLDDVREIIPKGITLDDVRSIMPKSLTEDDVKALIPKPAEVPEFNEYSDDKVIKVLLDNIIGGGDTLVTKDHKTGKLKVTTYVSPITIQSINGQQGKLSIVGDGGTSVTSENGTITISASGGGNETGETFEALSKNLRSYPATLSYTGSQLTSIAYNTGSGTITKTLNYTGFQLTSLVFSGDTPSWLTDTTKTLAYTGSQLTSWSYS